MFKLLDIKTNSELFLVKHGWFSPRYVLTDDAVSFGSISYEGFLRRKAVAETATNTWLIRTLDLFSRTISITSNNGTLLGTADREWLSRRVVLTMQTGFTAEFYRLSFWSRQYIWTSVGNGKLMQITSNLFNTKVTINIDKSTAPPALIPLLIFLGEHLIILRRRKKAAH